MHTIQQNMYKKLKSKPNYTANTTKKKLAPSAGNEAEIQFVLNKKLLN